MMPASTKKGGKYVNALPDACKTPPNNIPVPYPNTAHVASTNGAAKRVLIENKETVVEGSKVPNSSGDELGTGGGVVSTVNRGQVRPTQWSSKVFACGKKIVYHTATAAHNGSNPNTFGTQMTASQRKVYVAF